MSTRKESAVPNFNHEMISAIDNLREKREVVCSQIESEREVHDKAHRRDCQAERKTVRKNSDLFCWSLYCCHNQNSFVVHEHEHEHEHRAKSKANLEALQESKDAYSRTIEETMLVCESFARTEVVLHVPLCSVCMLHLTFTWYNLLLQTRRSKSQARTCWTW